jgi:hypothetical protein
VRTVDRVAGDDAETQRLVLNLLVVDRQELRTIVHRTKRLEACAELPSRRASRPSVHAFGRVLARGPPLRPGFTRLFVSYSNVQMGC